LAQDGMSQVIRLNYEHPLIQNFTSKEFTLENLTWGATQDQLGNIYTVNGASLLKYDGNEWTILAHITGISIFFDSISKTILVGSINNFGYIHINDQGVSSYVSLPDKLKQNKDIGYVWDCFSTIDGIFFLTENKLYRYKNGNFKIWDSKNKFHTAFAVDNKVLIREEGKGLLCLEKDKLFDNEGSEIFAEKRVDFIGKDLVEKNQFENIDFTPIQVWHLTVTDNGNTLLACTAKGIYEITKYGSKLICAEYENIFTVYKSKLRPNPYYASHAKGVFAFTYENGKFTIAGEISNLNSAILLIFGDKKGHLLLSSQSDGIYYAETSKVDFNSKHTDVNLVNFTEVSGLPDLKLNYITEVNDELLVLTVNGLYKFEKKVEISNLSLTEISKLRFVKYPEFNPFSKYGDGQIYKPIKPDKEGNLYITSTLKSGPQALATYIKNKKKWLFQSYVILSKNIINEPNEILNRMRSGIIKALKQRGESGESKDGMAMSLVHINKVSLMLDYAGANNPLHIVCDKNKPDIKNAVLFSGDADKKILFEIKGNKFPVGIHMGTPLEPFIKHEIQLVQGDVVYMFSDGYADQFDALLAKKLKYNQFTKFILESMFLTMEEQKIYLQQKLNEWQGDIEQVDDVLVMGVRIV
jgi:hypothetical protein